MTNIPDSKLRGPYIPFMCALKNIPQIVRLNYTTGNYSMFAEIVCKDIRQLRYVLHDELQKIKRIERTETFISLEESFSQNARVVKKTSVL